MLSALAKASGHVVAACIVVVVTLSLLHAYRGVLPWVALLVGLAIVARLVWSRTHY